ncbi:MAG: TRAP transporter small permease [Qingshengfaniella sp.]
MRNFLRHLEVAEKRLSAGLAVLGGLGAGLAMLMIVADVCLRLVGSQVPGTYVVTTAYFMLMLTFLPLMRVQSEDRMISVDALYMTLGPAMQRVLILLGQVLSLICYGALAYATLRDALGKTASRSYALSGTLAVPTWPGYYILPVCFALTLLAVLVAIMVHRGRLRDIAEADPIMADRDDRS